MLIIWVGGDIVSVKISSKIFAEYNFSPAETKKMFQNNGWRTIVAFQTRNVPHLGHEFLQKYALQNIDGLLVQPVIGEKKEEDFKDEHIISSYKILIDKYYPKGKILLSILPLKMRYAGPREALLHALIRKNFGCTHFIVGRDHTGMGDYYHPTAAQEIFNQFNPQKLRIKILRFSEVVYDKSRQTHCFLDECQENNIIKFSGTKLREFIKNKQKPPKYLIRNEVYDLLAKSHNPLINFMYKKNNNQGFVLWFTGLSASGKSTIADKVCEILQNRNIRIERLDGDEVRKNLTKNLGFSKKDRYKNIRRVGYVANLLSSNGVGVVASFISPYRKQRKELRKNVKNFIEIFVDTPLEICEARDPKGIYKKARAGEVKFFTGISDPYEEPQNPDIHLKTEKMSVGECANKILKYLKVYDFKF